MKALAPNTLLQNRYLIVQLIGKGGMGEVYLGVDQRLGSAMAIKRTFFSDDETLMLAFEREAKTLARLRHPALPKVSDHFNENDVQYLVMEHISGDDLSKRLEITNQPFPLNWVLFWADQLLDGLNYLHSHEPPIIHRDIKPQNLKLTSDNHIILLDFGLAKNSLGETRLSTSGSVVGYTPHYASMEQIRGTGTTPKSDIYSLSATLYQLLTNTVPPDALSRADSLLNKLPDPIQPLYELNPEVSHPISDVILKGMNLSADQRYPSAREMQKALRDAYAQVQTAMTAQTETFNLADIPKSVSQVSPVTPSSQAKTEDLSAQIANQIPQSVNTEYSPSPVSQAKTGEYQIPPPAENFDATIPYDMPMTGAKTEIIPNGLPSLSEPNPFSEKDSSNVSDSPAAKSEAFNFPTSDNLDSGKLDSYEDFRDQQSDANHATAVNFISLPKNEPQVEPSESVKVEEKAVPAQSSVSSVPPKKSNGKLFAIIGGILGLAILGIAAAGIALYVLKPDTATSATPTPTAVTEPTAEPTVEATPEPTLQADANTDTDANSNVNTQAVLTSDNTNVENPAVENPVTVSNPTRSTTDRTSRSNPTRNSSGESSRSTSSGDRKPPVDKKPTPKPTQDRTIILQ